MAITPPGTSPNIDGAAAANMCKIVVPQPALPGKSEPPPRTSRADQGTALPDGARHGKGLQFGATRMPSFFMRF
jgi:hypothetical protein